MSRWRRPRRRSAATPAPTPVATGPCRPPAPAARPARRRRSPQPARPRLRRGVAARPARRAAGPGQARAARSPPYDFDGDGRQQLVIAMLGGSPRGARRGSGVVLIRRRRVPPAWQVITESGAGVPGRPHSGDAFGSGLASGDFDRDGWADLAIGTPGKTRVSVLYGRRAASPAGARSRSGLAAAYSARRRPVRLPAARA